MDDISHENIVNDLRRRIEYNLDELHHITTWGLIGLSVITFIACMKITAPYGRHSDSKLGKKWWWGPSIPATIAWIIMECPSPILAAYFWFYGGRSSLSLLYIIVFLSHYLNRTFIFPFRMVNSSPMYAGIMMQGFFFNIVNGFLQGYQIGKSNGEIDGQVILGLAIFYLGWIINNHSDSVLRDIRLKSKGKYQIPYGGAYRFVSSANYFGEIVEWFGWTIGTKSLTGFAFFVFTFANLAPRASAHHQWYKEKFGAEYPRNRKAIIPFLW